MWGPRPGFEPGRRAPQARRLPCYLTSATISLISATFWEMSLDAYLRLLSETIEQPSRRQKSRKLIWTIDKWRHHPQTPIFMRPIWNALISIQWVTRIGTGKSQTTRVSCGRGLSSVKQKPVVKFKIKKDIIREPVREFDSRSDFAQVSIVRSNLCIKKTLHYLPFPIREDVSSQFSSHEPIAEKHKCFFVSMRA